MKPVRRRLTRPIKQQKHILCILNILNHHSCVLSFTIFPRPTFNSKQSLTLTNGAAGGRLTSLPPTFSLPSCAWLQFEAFEGRKGKVSYLEAGQKSCFLKAAEELLSRQWHDFLFFF